jgi:hypothetical protein
VQCDAEDTKYMLTSSAKNMQSSLMGRHLNPGSFAEYTGQLFLAPKG